MTKDVDSAAAVPATLTPPPHYHHEQPRHQILLLLRGPLIFLASLWYLILPFVLSSNLRTQISISALLLGTLLTILDLASTVRTRFDDIVKHRLRPTMEGVVLDDVLRSIFAPDTGWLAVMVGTFVGTAGMYALPLSEEQRVRLFGTGLADMNPQLTEADAHDVLTRPGGVVRLLPQTWRRMLTDDGQEEAEERVAVRVDERTTASHVGRDMDWNEDGDDIEEEEATADATDDSTSSHEGIDPTATNADRRIPPQVDGDSTENSSRDRRRTTAFPQSRPDHQPTARRSLSPTPSRLPPRPEDPVAVAASILTELITNLAKRSLQSIDTASVRTVGLASTAALLLQLRYSQSARRFVWSALQGATAVSLAGMGVGAALVTEARRRSEASSAPPTEEKEEEREASAGGGRRDPARPKTTTTAITRSSLATKLGGDLLRALLSSKSVLVGRIMDDGRLRRRLQAVVAVLVLMHFRRRRSKSRLMYR